MSFKARLRQMKSRFDEAKSSRSAFEDLPDGRYICRMTKAYLHEAESGKIFAVFSYTVIEGEEQGEVITDWNNLEHDVGLRIFCEKVQRLGHDVPDDPEEIEDTVKEIAADQPTVRLRLQSKTKGDRTFQSKNIDRVMEDYDGEGEDDNLAEAVAVVTDTTPEVEDDIEEEVEDDASFAVGDHVKWSKGEGDIINLDDDGQRAVIKRNDNGKKSRVLLSSLTLVASEEEDDEIIDEDDGEEIAVGQSVEIDGQGEGKVVRIDDENSLVHVKMGNGKKIIADPVDIVILRSA